MAEGPAAAITTAAVPTSLLSRSWAVLLFLQFVCPTVKGAPRFSNVFSSQMVLQRGRPIQVWGFGGKPGEALEVTLNPGEAGSVTWADAVAGEDGAWRAELNKQPASLTGKPLNLTLAERGGKDTLVVLTDVVLGDVYLFSGQSNVDLPVSYVHQFSSAAEDTEEQLADKIGRSGLVRFMIVPARCGVNFNNGYVAAELAPVGECMTCPPFGIDPHKKGLTNNCNLLGGQVDNYSYCNCDSLRWSRATGDNLRGFSALAWFTGRAIVESDVAKGVPLGLVRSSWGATNIAVWSGPDALAKCEQEGDPPSSFAPYVRSALFSHMVMPLKGLGLSAVVWFHGARNIGGPTPYMGGKYYSCALQAMIQDWREKLVLPSLPFLVVESPVYCNELDYRTWHTWCNDKTSKLVEPDVHLPEMRLAQNDAEKLPGVYVVSTMDQGSLKKAMGGAIHSIGKRDLGIRLAKAANKAVYNNDAAVWSGPRPRAIWRVGKDRLGICFDTGNGQHLVLNKSASCPEVVLPVYCTRSTFEIKTNGTWGPPRSIHTCGGAVTLELVAEAAPHATHVRYAWADWPVCSLYNTANLPARLFNMPVTDLSTAAAMCPMGTKDDVLEPGKVCSAAGKAGKSAKPTDTSNLPVHKVSTNRSIKDSSKNVTNSTSLPNQHPDPAILRVLRTMFGLTCLLATVSIAAYVWARPTNSMPPVPGNLNEWVSLVQQFAQDCVDACRSQARGVELPEKNMDDLLLEPSSTQTGESSLADSDARRPEEDSNDTFPLSNDTTNSTTKLMSLAVNPKYTSGSGKEKRFKEEDTVLMESRKFRVMRMSCLSRNRNEESR